mmetsp:Transcript_110770/g.253784  ORF Transcript_110770/g.253784 Transcript_110770/m.253784 type:complete len:217 (+) Transcript_110770:58-708(+)
MVDVGTSDDGGDWVLVQPQNPEQDWEDLGRCVPGEGGLLSSAVVPVSRVPLVGRSLRSLSSASCGASALVVVAETVVNGSVVDYAPARVQNEHFTMDIVALHHNITEDCATALDETRVGSVTCAGQFCCQRGEARVTFTIMVQNDGTQAWPDQVRFGCVDGDRLGAGDVNVPSLAPGEATVLTLTVSILPGDFASEWALLATEAPFGTLLVVLASQ